MALLFGPAGRVSSLDYADQLFLNPKGATNSLSYPFVVRFVVYYRGHGIGFGGLLNILKPNELIYPEHIKGWSFIDAPHTPFEAERLVMARLKENSYDLPRTLAWARATNDIRTSLRWNSIQKVLSWVSDDDKDEIIAAERAIEAGQVPVFHRYILVDFSNGISDVDATTGDVYRARVRTIIDITDIANPFLSAEKTEVTREYLGNVYHTLPETAPPTARDQAYLISFAQALYNTTDPQGARRVFVPSEGISAITILALSSPTHYLWEKVRIRSTSTLR